MAQMALLLAAAALLVIGGMPPGYVQAHWEYFKLWCRFTLHR